MFCAWAGFFSRFRSYLADYLLQLLKLPKIAIFWASLYKRLLSYMQLLPFLIVQGVFYLENTSFNCSLHG